MAVVSHDEGLEEACAAYEPLHHFKDLPKYLDAVASENEKLYKFAREAVLRLKDEIFEMATEPFRQLGAYLTDVDGDVDEITLTDMSLAEDVDFIALTREHAFIEIPASLTFTAEISYAKPSTGSYDSEDKVLYFPDRVESMVERSVDRNIGVALEFWGPSAESVKLVEVWVEGPDLAFESDDDEDWPYK
jgi:hypothetical protein